MVGRPIVRGAAGGMLEGSGSSGQEFEGPTFTREERGRAAGTGFLAEGGLS